MIRIPDAPDRGPLRRRPRRAGGAGGDGRGADRRDGAGHRQRAAGGVRRGGHRVPGHRVVRGRHGVGHLRQGTFPFPSLPLPPFITTTSPLFVLLSFTRAR